MDTTDSQRTPLRLGERLTVTVDSLASGGDGVGHPGGFALFIPAAAPGDVAIVEVTQVSRSFGRARIVSLEHAGPDRVSTPCPLASGCPGCQLQHLNYPAQLAAKQALYATRWRASAICRR